MAVMPDNRGPLCTLLEDHGVDPKSVVADSVRVSRAHVRYDRFTGQVHNDGFVHDPQVRELRREPLMWYLACTQAHGERKR